MLLSKRVGVLVAVEEKLHQSSAREVNIQKAAEDGSYPGDLLTENCGHAFFTCSDIDSGRTNRRTSDSVFDIWPETSQR